MMILPISCNSFRINTGKTQARCLHYNAPHRNALHHKARVRVQEPQQRLVRVGLRPRAARVAPATELANAHPLNDSPSACKFTRQVLGRAEPRALKQAVAYLSKPNRVDNVAKGRWEALKKSGKQNQEVLFLKCLRLFFRQNAGQALK